MMKKIMKLNENEKKEYVELTPVSDADPDGVYAKAISFAINSDNVKNIAITGPYGSGKSSIIKTFEEKNKEKYKFLNISLASFKNEVEDADENGCNCPNRSELSDASMRLVEKSILQQLLYGIDATKLPYSRFKRISVPKYPLAKTILFSIWILFSYVVVLAGNDFYANFIESSDRFYLFLMLVFALAFPMVLMLDLYRASFSISLKKISLTNAEIETDHISEDSVLNRHLDEIIYFFQVTDKKIVVFEDLDRFGNSEIFVKLREINKLINDSDKGEGSIKFIYAIKDDMFLHKNRTKFFDFIIPVIPIINSFNSLDMMQKRLSNFDVKINEEFIRYVSLHVDDLRLMHNTFNEFAIYYKSLKSKNLDPTKLLAVMVYKNTYPNDFENLHHGRGALFEICNGRKKYIEHKKIELHKALSDIKERIEAIDNEVFTSVQELIYAYLGYIVSCAKGKAVRGISVNGQNISISEFTSYEIFEPLLSEGQIRLHVFEDNYGWRLDNINKSFSQIEKEINESVNFLTRKSYISNKANEKKREMYESIQLLERELFELSSVRLSECLIYSGELFDDIISKNNIKNGELIEYLVKNDFIDDGYNLYISNFYEGRLTVNDRDFLISIRNFRLSDPNHKVDNAKEVCKNLRDDDFSNKFVLNVDLVNYLFSEDANNYTRINSLLSFISKNHKLAEGFFYSYFLSGTHVPEFIKRLSDRWPRLAVATKDIGSNSDIIFNVFENVDSEFVAKKMNDGMLLTSYLSSNGSVIKNFRKTHKLCETIKQLKIKFSSLRNVEADPEFFEYLINENLYEINKDNVMYILGRFGVDDSAATKSNYTSILGAYDGFKDYINKEINSYIENVMLEIAENKEESEEVMVYLLNNEVVTSVNKIKMISRQNVLFENISDIPSLYWATAITEGKVSATWINVLNYIDLDNFDDGIISEFLDINAENILSKQMVGITSDEQERLFKYIFHNKNISFESYCKLIIPFDFWCAVFPVGANEEKKLFLAENEKVYLNEKTYTGADGNGSIISALILVFPDYYFDEKDEFPISDAVRNFLVSSDLDEEYKIKLIIDFSRDYLSANLDLVVFIINIIVQNNNIEKIPADYVEFLITVSKDSISSIILFTAYLLSAARENVMGVLSMLNDPYKEIASYGKRPKLINNEFNRAFCAEMKRHGHISSFREEGDNIRINTLRLS